ncbi:hypothetical protein BC826DRAFT_519927 [Russula brevipes]|nr:hypothetical protein BC826DRAFT_519927 [Russula brevipes]
MRLNEGKASLPAASLSVSSRLVTNPTVGTTRLGRTTPVFSFSPNHRIISTPTYNSGSQCAVAMAQAFENNENDATRETTRHVSRGSMPFCPLITQLVGPHLHSLDPLGYLANPSRKGKVGRAWKLGASIHICFGTGRWEQRHLDLHVEGVQYNLDRIHCPCRRRIAPIYLLVRALRSHILGPCRGLWLHSLLLLEDIDHITLRMSTLRG